MDFVLFHWEEGSEGWEHNLFIPVFWQLRADRVGIEGLKELGDHGKALGQSLGHFSAPVSTTGRSILSFQGKRSRKVTKEDFSLAFNCCLVPSEGRQGNGSEACWVATGRPGSSSCQGGSELIPLMLAGIYDQCLFWGLMLLSEPTPHYIWVKGVKMVWVKKRLKKGSRTTSAVMIPSSQDPPEQREKHTTLDLTNMKTTVACLLFFKIKQNKIYSKFYYDGKAKLIWLMQAISQVVFWSIR